MKTTATTHPEQHENPKYLHREADQRPAHQDQQHARPERQRAAPLAAAREEGERALRAQQQRDADEEQDVAHGQQRAVEEQDQPEGEEEAAAAAEGYADFWFCVFLSALPCLVCGGELFRLLGAYLLLLGSGGRTLRVGEPHCRHAGREVWAEERMREGARRGGIVA